MGDKEGRKTRTVTKGTDSRSPSQRRGSSSATRGTMLRPAPRRRRIRVFKVWLGQKKKHKVPVFL